MNCSLWRWVIDANVRYYGSKAHFTATFFLFTPCTDHSLTLANLTQLLNNVEDLDSFHQHIRIPSSKYQTIKKEYFNRAERSKALCEWYLAHHPAPSWGDIADALYVSEEHAVLDVLRMHYLKGQCAPLFLQSHVFEP